MVLFLQVSELQEMVAWLTNHDHMIKDSPINPTPPELTPGLLDPNVSRMKAGGPVTRNRLFGSQHVNQQTCHGLMLLDLYSMTSNAAYVET